MNEKIRKYNSHNIYYMCFPKYKFWFHKKTNITQEMEDKLSDKLLDNTNIYTHNESEIKEAINIEAVIKNFKINKGSFSYKEFIINDNINKGKKDNEKIMCDMCKTPILLSHTDSTHDIVHNNILCVKCAKMYKDFCYKNKRKYATL
jgi:hypothetical protein